MLAQTTLGSDGAGDPERFLSALERAGDGFGELRFASIHSVGRQPGDVDAALEGRFRLGERRFTLAAPIDWWDAPYRGPREQAFFQNSFVFADPLLSDPRLAETLEPLAAVFCDWLAANPRGGGAHSHRYAWHDHAAAARLVYMSFTLREGVRLGALTPSQRLALATGSLEHASFLLSTEHYEPAHNHGLFSDAALALAARSLGPVPPTAGWADEAERRFGEVLARTIAATDAVHLEHSPYYHWIIHGAIGRFAAADLFPGLGLNRLVERMEESGSWLVAPDGTLPPIGDTPYNRSPPEAVRRAAASRSGVRLFREAGYAAIRRDDSYLVVTAAHHPTAHKHADDGSFCLYEQGLPLVVDSGDPGHDYSSAERRYGTSPIAQATVCVDGYDWSREGAPYGSGIVAAAEADDVHAVLTANPTVAPGGGGARRVFAYAPGRFLAMVDLVDAEPGQQLRRHLPLAPDLSAVVSPEGTVEISRDEAPVAQMAAFAPSGVPAESIELVVGRRGPELGGFVFPEPGEAVPNCSVSLVAPGGQPRALALVCAPARVGSPELSYSASGGVVELEIRLPVHGPIRLRCDPTEIAFVGKGSASPGTP
jgi:hypothetical protein